MEKSYTPVDFIDDERNNIESGDETETLSFLQMRKKRLQPFWSTWTQFAHITILYSIIVILISSLVTEPHWRSCSDPSIGLFSPAQDAVVYEDVNFGKYFAADNKSPYTQEPSTELDAMWSDLYNFGLTGITREEAAQLHDPTVHLPHDNDTYIVSLGVFHQLHCVNHLRKALYPDEYPGLWEFNEDGTVNHNTILALHWDHCIDILRQTLMCHSDITPTPFYYRRRDDNVYSTLATTHRCRDFNKIREWAEVRQLHSWRWNETTGQVPVAVV